MTRPKRKFLGLSWLGWVNFYILQWFFLRLALMADTNNSNKICKIGFVYGCLPFTGWSFLPFKRYWPFKKQLWLFNL